MHSAGAGNGIELHEASGHRMSSVTLCCDEFKDKFIQGRPRNAEAKLFQRPFEKPRCRNLSEDWTENYVSAGATLVPHQAQW
eukprot:SAG22_NODE_420_length_10739_cov_7.090320_14_plen_82_part_00